MTTRDRRMLRFALVATAAAELTLLAVALAQAVAR